MWRYVFLKSVSSAILVTTVTAIWYIAILLSNSEYRRQQFFSLDRGIDFLVTLPPGFFITEMLALLPLSFAIIFLLRPRDGAPKAKHAVVSIVVAVAALFVIAATVFFPFGYSFYLYSLIQLDFGYGEWRGISVALTLCILIAVAYALVWRHPTRPQVRTVNLATKVITTLPFLALIATIYIYFDRIFSNLTNLMTSPSFVAVDAQPSRDIAGDGAALVVTFLLFYVPVFVLCLWAGSSLTRGHNRRSPQQSESSEMAPR